jgi:transcriptional regulator with XRE-family HTH domain
MIENTVDVQQKTWWDGQWLRDVRLKKGLRVIDVAERAHVSPSAIQDTEANRVGSPGIIFLRQVAAAMDVPLSSLLGEAPEGEEYHSGYSAAMLDAQDALHSLRREHGG